MSISLFIYIIWISLIFAFLEIQIEGARGWAENLPCWKYKNPFRKIIGWTTIDGYHVYCWLLFGSLFHLPYFFGYPITIENEFNIILSFFLFGIFEDFLWFVFNPAWGIKKFFTKEIPWHPKKILFFPQNYWIQFTTLLLLLLARNFVLKNFQ